MGDWLHCNVCIRIPNSGDGIPFYFTCCGHIICQRCIANADNGTCRVCRKPTKILEINRTLRPEHQMLFRNPKDLLEMYVKNINSVLDFQAHHRSRLFKARQEQQRKAAKFVMSAQAELKHRTESEKKAIAEKNNLAEEMAKLRQHAHKLEEIIAQQSASSRQRAIESNNINFMLIFVVLLQHSSTRSSSSSKRFSEVFTGGEAEPSPIVCEAMLTTPDMLGLKKNNNKHK
uniref:RING-type domain-containing protein n=1 Tax=Syphacia muris TaxID=451379 RepID=A0A0N5AJY4_9BILA